MRRLVEAGLAAAVAAGLLAGAAGAQTPSTSVGLGYPTPPLDARSAALGGVGVGLLGGTFSIANPADLAVFSEAALSVTAAPEAVSPEGAQNDTGRSRFPAIRAVIPVGSWTGSVGFASHLDQDWRFTDRDTLDISAGRFPFEQRRENDGGVSAVDVSLGRSVGPLSVGVSYQLLTGSLRQDLVRQFSVSVDSTLPAPARVEQNATWSYSGWRLKGGLGLQISDRVRISGVYTWAGDLEAEPDSVVVVDGEPTTSPRTYAMPASARVGASARLTDGLLLAAGGGVTRWSEADADLREERARDVYWGGGGVEYGGLDLLGVPLDVRAGARWRELPFRLPGRAFADERAVSMGLGTQFSGGIASLDLALELGSRGTLSRTGFEESFRRLTFTATIRQ